METLFSNKKRPLPYRLIPETIDQFIGQEHITGKGKPLRRLIERDKLFSSIFWGPPGTGKTTLARLISKLTKSEFIELNAVTSTIQDIRKALEIGRKNFNLGIKTILFIDEIHRFNKTQQDALLPDLEAGNVVLIGASTENPFFSIVPALRSRVKLYEFEPLSDNDLRKLYEMATTDPRGLPGFKLPEDVLNHLIRVSAGDGRKFLTYIEELHTLSGGKEPDIQLAEEVTGKAAIHYGKGDDHYDVISAFIKSIRGSDPDAALYYLAKMLVGGEDPAFIARRLVILASEDIGNANPEALLIAHATMDVVQKIGMPEAALTLAQATIYLSMSPKSNAVYRAIKKAMSDVESGVDLPVPMHLRDSHYKGAKETGRGVGYKYPHDYPRHWVKQEYLSEKRKYYESEGIGFEKQLEDWIKWMKGEK